MQPAICNSAVDLATVVSPITGSTATADGGGNTHSLSCGGNGNEALFMIMMEPGATINIGMDSNGYASHHETRWGGACPGETPVPCPDDPDTRRHNWANDQTTAQPLYFFVDAYSTGSGTFQLSWVLGSNVGEVMVHGGGSHCTTSAQCPNCEGDCDDDGDCASGLMCWQRR